jgi:predicted lysophospholipase L1 biosynthesis ABC-type transport system permease subunit
VEYAVIGAIAGLVGATGANLLAWAVLSRGFEMSWSLRPVTTAVAVLLAVALTASTAVAAGWGALQRRPLAALKAE